jgi:glycine cleavage system regulatory protein
LTMTSYLVLTVIAEDRPGLVESLAEVIAENSGSWLESSMSQLAGKFAGILKVSVDDASLDQLELALGSLRGLKLVIERVMTDETVGRPITVELNLVANDRPGIVREISHAVADLSVNVEKLITNCSSAPMSGVTLFKANAILKVPPSLELTKLQEELESLADDMIVEINVS